MIEMLADTYQDLLFYSTYVCFFLYILFFLYKQWARIHISNYPIKRIDPFHIILDSKLYHLRMECVYTFLVWLPKTIRKKDHGSDDEPDGLFFLHS